MLNSMSAYVKSHVDHSLGRGIYSPENEQALRNAGILDNDPTFGNHSPMPYFSPQKMTEYLREAGVLPLETAGAPPAEELPAEQGGFMLKYINSQVDFFLRNGVYSAANVNMLANAGILDEEGNMPYFSPDKMRELLREAGVLPMEAAGALPAELREAEHPAAEPEGSELLGSIDAAQHDA